MSKENQSADAQVKIKGVQKGLIKGSKDLLGMYVSQNITPEALVLKCDEHIANCNRWIANVTVLKADTEAAIKVKRVEALKASVSSMSAEEKDEIIKLLSA